MNARTGTLLDYIPHDTNIPTDIPCSYTIDRETPRLSKDTIVNIQGRHLLDLCISMGLRILNGRNVGDSHGSYICFTPRSCSVVDYLLVSADLQQRVLNFQVAEFELTTYSDHCPIIFELKQTRPFSTSEDVSHIPLYSLASPLQWDKQNRMRFHRLLQANDQL